MPLLFTVHWLPRYIYADTLTIFRNVNNGQNAKYSPPNMVYLITALSITHSTPTHCLQIVYERMQNPAHRQWFSKHTFCWKHTLGIRT